MISIVKRSFTINISLTMCSLWKNLIIESTFFLFCKKYINCYRSSSMLVSFSFILDLIGKVMNLMRS